MAFLDILRTFDGIPLELKKVFHSEVQNIVMAFQLRQNNLIQLKLLSAKSNLAYASVFTDYPNHF